MLRRRPIHSNTDDSNQFSRGLSEDDSYRSANTTIKMKERDNCRGRSSCNSREMGSTSTTPERRDYQRYESKWYGIWRAVGRFFDYVYLFMVTVFFSDTWLLSRLSGVRRSMGQRRSRVLWIALVPLVLLAGWCPSYSSTLFLPGEVIPPHLRDSPVISVKGGRESSNYETYEKRDDLEFIIDQLSSRISSLEDQVFQHSNKILQLEEGLMGQKLSDMYTQEMDVIQSQLEKLKGLKNHANYVSNGDSGKRIEIIHSDYCIDTSVLMKGDVEVQEKLSMVKDTAAMTDTRVRELIKEALQIYDADKTGRADVSVGVCRWASY